MKTLTSKKDYINFVSTISGYKEDLSKIAGRKVLTYDEEEIRAISDFFIDTNNNDLFDLHQRKMFITYLGEAFMKRYGGKWNYNSVKKDTAYNEPVITKFKNEGIRFCPMEHIKSILESGNANEFNESLAYRDAMSAKTDAVFAELFSRKKRKK